jgi:glucan phosphorylase
VKVRLSWGKRCLKLCPATSHQLIFAGKAHPRDEPGKELIRQIVRLSRGALSAVS